MGPGILNILQVPYSMLPEVRSSSEIYNSSSEVEKLAASVADNGGVYLVPAFAGFGAAHWDQFSSELLGTFALVYAVFIFPVPYYLTKCFIELYLKVIRKSNEIIPGSLI